MVELRKRKTPPPAPVRPAKRSAAPRGKNTAAADKKTAAADKKTAAADKTPVEKATKVASETVEAVTEAVSEAVEAVKEAVTGTDSANGTAEPAAALKVGDTIDLATFGGEVETHDGTKTTLKQLVEASKGGVVLFTYPKASTPGCKFAPAPAPTIPLHTLTRRRHHAGLPLPRLVRAPHCNGLRHLWSVQR
jgi:peroxiredoxin Q/BCP